LPEHLPEQLPAGVRVLDYVPFRRLLARSAALVHHGGVGTAAQALAAGIPQVVRPVVFDQPDNAARLLRLGVSETIAPEHLDADSLARATERVLASARIRDRCTEIAGWLGPDAEMERACAAIESVPR
jgi:UDP:flavonoid glycosyltransferase YjiC (YdhE family)